MHRRSHLPGFVEKLFMVCETEKSPLAESYWLQVTVNSLLHHANKEFDSVPAANQDKIELDKSLAVVK
jgi:hypothetical protein